MTHTALPELNDPVRLRCGQSLPNRLMKSALSEALAEREAPSAQLERLYARWGAGGYGLIVTGNVMVDRAHLGEPGNVVVEDDRDADALRRWAKTAQDGGASVWMQINHPGRQAMVLATRNRPVAPSSIAPKVPGYVRPRELRSAEIEEIVDRFAATAAVAEATGFNGVQVHAAHGYLVTQFLSPLSNHRDDEWGGDAERRRRFLIEVIRRIRAAVSPSFGVGVKLNSADFQRGGFTEEDSREVVRALVAEAVDLIEVSGGSYEAPVMVGQGLAASTVAREAYFLEYAATLQELSEDVAVAVTGGFRTKAAMARAVASGACDIVGLGRPSITAPEAATTLLEAGAPRSLHQTLVDVRVRAGFRSVLGRLVDLKQIDGILDLQWHTDQLHRIGKGKEPDLKRRWWQTAASMVIRNGRGSLTRRRS